VSSFTSSAASFKLLICWIVRVLDFPVPDHDISSARTYVLDFSDYVVNSPGSTGAVGYILGNTRGHGPRIYRQQ
jgi:hypothetical protein